MFFTHVKPTLGSFIFLLLASFFSKRNRKAKKKIIIQRVEVKNDQKASDESKERSQSCV